MNTGQYISAGAHFGLVAYVLFGGFFLSPRDTETVQSQEVSLISESDFAALSRVETAPDVANEAPKISAPTIDSSTESAALAAPERMPPPKARPETPPDPSPADQAPPLPVAPTAPVPPAREVSVEDSGASLPDVANQEPTPRPVPRIAPEAVVNPDQTPDIADQATPEVSPDAEATAEVVPDVPAAAPQEAVTETVTEADTPSGMTSSPRPKARPQSVVRQAALQAEDKAKSETTANTTADAKADAAANAAANAVADAAADAVAALAAEAAADTPAAPSRPAGPPMSAGEKDALRVAVSQCWNTGSMSTEAQRTKVTVGLSMNQDGTPITGSIRLLGSTGGDAASAEQAFQTARRAIIRCGRDGYSLPAEKFDSWKDIEILFNPENMRFK